MLSFRAYLAYYCQNVIFRLEEEIARMKKNQERRLHRKNAKIAKEGGTPMQLSRLKPDTTVCLSHLYCLRDPFNNYFPRPDRDAVDTVDRWAI